MSTRSARTQHKSFRLEGDVAARLERRSDELGTSQTGLAERCIDEGLRTDEHPSISFRSGAAGRRPVLAGTRLDVSAVIETLKAHDGSIEETAGYFGLSDREVRACVAYYAEFEDEIDAWIERAHAAADRLEAAWQREQELIS